VKEGGPELADHLEEVGYREVRKEFGIDTDDASSLEEEPV
jgi:Fe-S cluster assembly ATPase SufC